MRRGALFAFLFVALFATPVAAQEGWWTRFSHDDWLKISFEYNKGDFDYAARAWRRLAEQGDPRSQASLGFLLYLLASAEKHCSSCPPYETKGSFDEAVLWLERAAEQGNANAMSTLSNMYDNENGISPDPEKAAYWRIAAAENGDLYSFVDASELLWNGVGVAADPVRAYMWWRLSAGMYAFNPDSDDARRFAGLTDVQRAEAERLAIAWMDDLKARNPYYWLGWQYWRLNPLRGSRTYDPAWIDASKRIAEARFFDIWFGEEAYLLATSNLAEAYEAGVGVPADPAEAARWRALSESRAAIREQREAEEGDSQALYELARRYRDGVGVDRDPVEALKWAIVARERKSFMARSLQDIDSDMTPAQIAEAERRAAAWLAAHPPPAQ